MTQNSKIDEANASAIASSRMIGTVLIAVLFVCSACLIAAVLIASAKGLLFSCLYFLPVPSIFQGQISTEILKG